MNSALKTFLPIVVSGLLIMIIISEGFAKPPPIPLEIPEENWRPLIERFAPDLQRDLEKALNRNKKWRSLILRQKMAVGVVDLTFPLVPRFARVNGNTMMYAASLPKIAVLLAAQVCLEEGSLKETAEIRKDMIDMIRVSSNSAATRMIERIGLHKIQEVLVDPRYQLYDEKKGGGLWVGKPYAKEGKRNPDPIKGLSHAATVLQTCRFYYMLAYGKIISHERSKEILEILTNPGIKHKFVGVIEKRSPMARLFRKSGTWKYWHSDSIMVWGPVWRRYILVAMVESEDGDRILNDLVPVVEQVLHHGSI